MAGKMVRTCDWIASSWASSKGPNTPSSSWRRRRRRRRCKGEGRRSDIDERKRGEERKGKREREKKRNEKARRGKKNNIRERKKY